MDHECEATANKGHSADNIAEKEDAEDFSSFNSNECDLGVQDEEFNRLSSYSSLQTIVRLSFGPLISQIIQSFYALADSLWVARTIGQEGIAVYGTVFIIEFLAINISNYLMSAISIRLSYLFGEGREEECSQIYVDFLRFALIVGIIVPVCVLPATKPIVKWFGADEHLSDLCLQYMYPVSLFCFLNFLYTMACGLLQAEGRSALFGLVQFLSMVANTAVFDPLMLIGFKLPIWGASTATILSQGIPGVILTILIYIGKFSLKPNRKMFLTKPSAESYEALKVAFSSFLSNLSFTIPLVLIQKYVGQAANVIGEYETIISVWAVISKVYQLVVCICIGFQNGFLPAAAFAFGANRLNRLFWLFIHATWLGTLVSGLLGELIVIIPDKIAQIWNNEPEFLKWSSVMIPRTCYTSPSIAVQYMAPALLQSMQKVCASLVISILILLLPIPIFSSIMYFTKKDDPARIIWSYALNDGWSFTISILFCIGPVRLLMSAPKDEKINDEKEDETEEEEWSSWEEPLESDA